MPIIFPVATPDRYEDRASARSSKAAPEPVKSGDAANIEPTDATLAAGSQAPQGTVKRNLSARIGVPVFAVLLAAGTAALLVWGPIGAEAPYRGLIAQPLVAALLTIAFAAVMMGPVSVHYRGQTYLFALSEVPLLLALVIAAPVVLVICRVLGEGFALGVMRRQSPMKLAFNLASAAMSCVVAIVVYRAILHPFIHPGSSRVAVLPIGWAAGAVALGAAFLYGHLAVTVVVHLNGHAQRRKYGFEFTTVALVLVSSIALALVVLDAAWWDTWAVPPCHGRRPDHLRLPGLSPTDEQVRSPSAALRLQQISERALSRDYRNGMGSPRAGAVGHAGQPSRADHHGRMALGETHRPVRRRPLDGAKDDCRQLVCDRQGRHQATGKPAGRYEQQPQARFRC